ncbi:MAG TPA: hypothetical protein DDW68_03345 [Verrucomicrobiales bacterium]|jgi:hypothetical protein|nr:hypothetical protein [Verrucomicrobiales bacterium]HBE96191.1 hypothetical protein [Verrucomicrobiales bacterium]
MSEHSTAFSETANQLARQLREAALDHAAFEQKLPLCELAKCRATCCHDGVILGAEEADVLSSLSSADGLMRLPDGSWKTKTVPAAEDELAEDFPNYFPNTRCVFLDSEHRCFWQLRAMREGKHPWFYKPTSCWMHPVLLTQRNDRPLLTILSSSQDRKQFASMTPCGREEAVASSARVSLKSELEMLSGIAGRDFLRELNAPELDVQR